MNRSELEEKVMCVIAETMNLPRERLTASTQLAADLDADSVAMVDIFMALEDALGVNLVDKYKQEVATVADVIACVAAQLPE